MIIDKIFVSHFVLCSLKPIFFSSVSLGLSGNFGVSYSLVISFCFLGNHFHRISLSIFNNTRIAFHVY